MPSHGRSGKGGDDEGTAVRIERADESAERADGYRVLIDHIWPQGVSKKAARLDEWARELAPSNELRRWFGHAPERFEECDRRYRIELADDRGWAGRPLRLGRIVGQAVSLGENEKRGEVA